MLLGCDSWMCIDRRYLPPLSSEHGVLGKLEFTDHARADVSASAVDPVASGGGCHPRYEGAVGTPLSDEQQLLAVTSVCSNGSPPISGHYLVDMLPQSGLPQNQEYFVASGRQVLSLIGVADLEPGYTLGVAHAPLMSVPLDVLQSNH